VAIHFRHQDVGRFQVAVDDGFLMGVLDTFADVDEQFQPLAGDVSPSPARASCRASTLAAAPNAGGCMKPLPFSS
jgi:hypothetical protein